MAGNKADWLRSCFPVCPGFVKIEKIVMLLVRPAPWTLLHKISNLLHPLLLARPQYSTQPLAGGNWAAWVRGSANGRGRGTAQCGD